MKTLLCILMLFPATLLAAPFLEWDAVTTDTSGNPLGPGLEVKSYKIYRCGTSLSGPCLAPDRALVATVLAPATRFDLAGEIFPMVYVATSVNILGESTDSLKIKATPATFPKNPRFQ